MHIKRVAIFFIRVYQITPLHSHSMCRFTPTCSEYAKESISTYGSIKGSYLTFKRILKCNPIGPYGYDPVPTKEKKNEKKKN